MTPFNEQKKKRHTVEMQWSLSLLAGYSKKAASQKEYLFFRAPCSGWNPTLLMGIRKIEKTETYCSNSTDI